MTIKIKLQLKTHLSCCMYIFISVIGVQKIRVTLLLNFGKQFANKPCLFLLVENLPIKLD